MEIIVHGATGRMGQKLLSLMETTPGCTLAAAVSPELTTCPEKREFYALPEYQGAADVIIDFSFRIHPSDFFLLSQDVFKLNFVRIQILGLSQSFQNGFDFLLHGNQQQRGKTFIKSHLVHGTKFIRDIHRTAIGLLRYIGSFATEKLRIRTVGMQHQLLSAILAFQDSGKNVDILFVA